MVLTDLKDLLLMAHAGLAIAFRSDKIEIDDGEAEKLARAIEHVARHYNMPDIASETKDWIGLIITAGTIYGPRMVASSAERKAEKARSQPEPPVDNVVSMTADKLKGAAP